MNLWGVTVLELDCHPDHNKGPDYVPCPCPQTHNLEISGALSVPACQSVTLNYGKNELTLLLSYVETLLTIEHQQSSFPSFSIFNALEGIKLSEIIFFCWYL